ncbi:hypothetical protein [Flavisolibacter ginsenosidimutans]|uniref:Lipoprotein n=1 Tax=Flavisolibacter ginsenosidimutans TaxID=661481 RepID=A0A5B8UGS8_9BACT|nr:hypothetical protein [Flavisolibacter ginsenosidimutans]QEC55847.1 hypothetical protein FSB75_08045 [Flavisolibacter ginsenosidimutans]
MKQLLIILALAVASCTSQQPAEQQESKTVNNKEKAIAAIPLNNGTKWKADEATKKNIAAMVQIVNDSTYQNAGKRKELSTSIQDQIDRLVKQCSMKGAEHDALHVWLEKVLKDVKELKEEETDEYDEAYAALKKDVESFYDFFE